MYELCSRLYSLSLKEGYVSKHARASSVHVTSLGVPVRPVGPRSRSRTGPGPGPETKVSRSVQLCYTHVHVHVNIQLIEMSLLYSCVPHHLSAHGLSLPRGGSEHPSRIANRQASQRNGMIISATVPRIQNFATCDAACFTSKFLTLPNPAYLAS